MTSVFLAISILCAITSLFFAIGSGAAGQGDKASSAAIVVSLIISAITQAVALLAMFAAGGLQ